MENEGLLSNLEPSESFVEKFVGEGKKYKDVEELAKAYDNADRHIKTMNDDNGKLREEFKGLTELVTAQLTKRKEEQRLEPVEPNPQHKPAGDPPKVEEVDLDAKISKALEEQDERKRLKDNADFAEQAMIKHFGSKEDAIEAVRKRAAELGVSPQWLADTAFQSPSAFFASMGIQADTQRKSTATPGPSSDINVQRLNENSGAVKPGTYKWYEEMRRKEPAKYFTAAVQSELMENAQKLGPDFYN